MDPVTTAILAAIAAGATKAAGAAGESLITDAYAALKELLKRKFGDHGEVVKAVESVEAKPESAGRKETLHEEVAASQADQDPDIRVAAQQLLEQLRALPGGGTHVQQAIGSYIAQADRGGTASVQVTGPKE